ncbi:hypothetical protein [Lacrimispora sp. AGF001]|uniref:hypothetical protein n=1 Tax=Lacrimispora sp. AGF001 TaxID=3401631 RepID=UPI003B4353C8
MNVKKCFIIIGVCLLLSGCSKATVEKEMQTSAAESVTEVSSTEDSEMNTQDLPNLDYLKKKLNDCVAILGISEVSDAYYENVEKIDSDTIFLDVILTTDLYKLKCTCSYIGLTDHWAILYVENNENNHTYYIAPGHEETVDLYDYATDTLISKKKDNPETKDPVTDFNESMESINEDFDSKLNSIADQYNIRQ